MLLSARRSVRIAVLALVGLCGTAPSARAQQNLFNVPNGQITGLGDVFFQQQFNFARPAGTSNSTFDFGLGRGFEIGFNALDFNMYERLGPPAPGERRQVNPDLLVNAQKGFELIDEVWSLGIGTQAGVNPARQSRQVRFQNFTWGVSELTLTEGGLKAYVGAYYANTAYAGPGARGGFMLGTEVPIIKDKVHFQADFISGRRDISVGVVGAVFFLPNKWQLSLGAQLPAPRSGNPYGAVIELTLPGYPLFARNRP